MKTFITASIVSLSLIVAMNVMAFFSHRTYETTNERMRLSTVTHDSVTAQSSSGEQATLSVWPPIWRYEGGGASMVLRHGTANQRTYTFTYADIIITRVSTFGAQNTVEMQYVFAYGTTLSGASVSAAMYPVIPAEALYVGNPQHIEERNLIDWMIEKYWENPTFTGFTHNILLSVLFLPLGLSMLCFPDVFRKFGSNSASNEPEPPLTRNKWFRVVGVLIVGAVFIVNIFILY